MLYIVVLLTNTAAFLIPLNIVKQPTEEEILFEVAQAGEEGRPFIIQYEVDEEFTLKAKAGPVNVLYLQMIEMDISAMWNAKQLIRLYTVKNIENVTITKDVFVNCVSSMPLADIKIKFYINGKEAKEPLKIGGKNYSPDDNYYVFNHEDFNTGDTYVCQPSNDVQSNSDWQSTRFYTPVMFWLVYPSRYLLLEADVMNSQELNSKELEQILQTLVPF